MSIEHFAAKMVPVLSLSAGKSRVILGQMNTEKPGLTWKKIATFWLPLYSTWLMMSMEGPFIAAIIAACWTQNSIWPPTEWRFRWA